MENANKGRLAGKKETPICDTQACRSEAGPLDGRGLNSKHALTPGSKALRGQTSANRKTEAHNLDRKPTKHTQTSYNDKHKQAAMEVQKGPTCTQWARRRTQRKRGHASQEHPTEKEHRPAIGKHQTYTGQLRRIKLLRNQACTQCGEPVQRGSSTGRRWRNPSSLCRNHGL